MNTRTIVIASFTALAIGVGVPSLAATDGQNQAGDVGMMQPGQGPGSMGQGGYAGGMMGGQPGNMMSGPRGGGMAGGYGMPGSGMMGNGMMGMMNGFPAMAGASLDPKTAMQMHGEMMRAMGDILVKYADKVQSSSDRP